MKASRSARIGSLAAAYSVVALAGVVALAVLSARHPVRLDLTRDRHQSLTAETRRILASIPAGGQPVEILAITSFAAGAGNPAEAQRQLAPLLERLRKTPPRRITARIVFAESDPALVQALAVDKTPMIIVRWTPPGDPADAAAIAAPRERRTDLVTEQAIAEVVQAVIEGRRDQVYLLAGHGEMQRDDAGPAGFAGAAALLSGLNFEPHDLLLAGAADIPADAGLVAIVGPESDLLPDEIAALRRYAERGGRILVLHGPAREPGRFHALEGWLKADWGIACTNGVVADLDAPLQGNQVTLLLHPGPQAAHAIMRGFAKRIEIAASRKIEPDPHPPDGVAAEVLLASGPRSWLETNLTTQVPRYDEEDPRGPHSLAIAATRKPAGQEKEARLVVVGSRLIASNLFLGEVGNADHLRNIVAWLTGREADIEGRSGDGQDGTVVIAARQGTAILAGTLAVPFIVALAGVATWWWRRRL